MLNKATVVFIIALSEDFDFFVGYEGTHCPHGSGEVSDIHLLVSISVEILEHFTELLQLWVRKSVIVIVLGVVHVSQFLQGVVFKVRGVKTQMVHFSHVLDLYGSIIKLIVSEIDFPEPSSPLLLLQLDLRNSSRPSHIKSLVVFYRLLILLLLLLKLLLVQVLLH